ncbi:MAG: 50S ribosomal protein L35 [Nitrospirae bacterium]|nr:MAG: 50S ribosomal protein L35 [Nitrospirota bacterium]
MAGQKLKSHSGASKRLRRSGTGKLMRRKAGRRHILTSKARDRKRRLKGSVVVDKTMTMVVNRLLPYNS